MAVKNRLPSRLTDIEPDVIPGRREILLDQFFTNNDQRHRSPSLFRCERKEIRRMAERDDQHVAAADREAVPHGKAEFIAGDNILSDGITERAFHIYSMADTFVPQSYTCIFRLNCQMPGPASDPDHNFLQLVKIEFAG